MRARDRNRNRGAVWAGVLVLILSANPIASLAGNVPPEQRTADMPDSWLILYNVSSEDSVAWAAWYQAQWGIPPENMLGLQATVNEHVPTLAAIQDQVIGPVRDLLASSPELQGRIMGILLGYRLPGHYASPPAGGPGGFSVANALQDMSDDALAPASQKNTNRDCPALSGLVLPAQGRLTRATMAANRYMTARIDAPTLEGAMSLTVAAASISSGEQYCNDQFVWYDYRDAVLPAGTWHWLKVAVNEPLLAEVPWSEYDSDFQQSPHDAIRLDTHDCDGWNDDRLFSPEPGLRVLAFNYNSWGATTVRSTTDDGGRFVPNALAAGYAAAIGSTGEPVCCASPIPATLLAALREGWTMGETFYLANPYDDWMWTLVGDPLLTMGRWFDEIPQISPGLGDLNEDGVVDGRDVQGFVGVWTGVISDPAARAQADLNGDGILDDTDLFLFGGPLLHESNDPNVLRGSGDASGDGIVDGADIPIFIDRLFNGFQGNETLRQLYGPDMNRDGEVTADDIPLFVDALLGIPPADGDPVTVIH